MCDLRPQPSQWPSDQLKQTQQKLSQTLHKAPNQSTTATQGEASSKWQLRWLKTSKAKNSAWYQYKIQSGTPGKLPIKVETGSLIATGTSSVRPKKPGQLLLYETRQNCDL